MERYYNFGGEGVMAAAAAGAKTVLEVNAPVIDHEGSTKARLDRALIVEPMRRWRERICARADLIVTPSAAILPRDTPSRKIVRLEWGADTDRFLPDAPGTPPFERPATTVAIFAGAFRSWHGAINLVRAVRELHARGRSDIGAVLVGDGPELPAVQDEAAGPIERGHHWRRSARGHARVLWPRPTSASPRSRSARTVRCRSGSTGLR